MSGGNLGAGSDKGIVGRWLGHLVAIGAAGILLVSSMASSAAVVEAGGAPYGDSGEVQLAPRAERGSRQAGGSHLRPSELLYAYQGIIGAVVGSAVTLLTTAWLRSRGTVRCFALTFRVFPRAQGRDGSFGDCSLEQAERCDIRLAVDVHNSKDIPCGLRHWRLHLSDEGGNDMLNLTLYDEATRHQALGGSVAEPLNVLNIAPHGFIHLRLSAFVDGEEVAALRASATARIVADLQNGRVLLGPPWSVGEAVQPPGNGSARVVRAQTRAEGKGSNG